MHRFDYGPLGSVKVGVLSCTCWLVLYQVPTYLLERKLQLAQEHEARMAAKAAAAIPAGVHTALGLNRCCGSVCSVCECVCVVIMHISVRMLVRFLSRRALYCSAVLPF